MIVRIPTVLLFALLILVAGCGEDDNPVEQDGLSASDFVGSWIATSAVHTNAANSSQSFDIVANGGEVRVTVLSPGDRSRTWVELGDFSDEWDSALSLDGDVLTSNPVEAGRPTNTFTVSLTGGVFTLTDESSEFDFTLSGASPVMTTHVIRMIPN